SNTNVGSSTVVTNHNDQMGGVEAQSAEQTASTDAINSVTEADHIKGSVDAPIKIVEYSDFECPFCQRFHDTMNEVMNTYGESGEVAWVFRQFPLEQLHSKAPTVALASECVAELGGNEAFWHFADRYFEVSPSNNRTDIETVIPQLVTEIGIDQNAFQSCMDSGEFTTQIEEDLNNAVATGGRGTPWTILIAPNGTTFSINGAQSISTVEQLIEIARDET
ncbi:MAG: thioredoxin domain-containing protein, partial [Candidatus Paceibacterota bacterium]